MNRKKFWCMGICCIALCSMIMACLQPAEPRLGAAGIGVADLDKATDFYTRVVGMTVKYHIRQPTMEQVVLEFQESKGSDVVLMHYTDGSDVNYKDVPAKLVFYVPDAYAFADAISAEGLTILTEPAPTEYGVVVGMAKDHDGYWVEIVQDETVSVPYLGGVGIGVTDLEASAEFYTRVLGMEEQYRLDIPNLMQEIILQIEDGGGSAVVLMHWEEWYQKNYTDNPVKLTFFVNDPRETIADIEKEGLQVIRKPKGRAKFNPFAYGLAKDRDGYLLDIMQSVEPIHTNE